MMTTSQSRTVRPRRAETRILLIDGTPVSTLPPMRFRTLILLLLLGATLGAQSPAEPPQERDFLSRIRRLTLEGRRSGEGYWGPDGKTLVFQSEREAGNPFYQIYKMDLTSGNVERVSPGMGKTTCSFINPQTGDILFSSTHNDLRS